jgi:hypothetical protein
VVDIVATIMPAVLVTATRATGFVMSPMIALAMSSGSAFFTSFAPVVPAVSSVLMIWPLRRGTIRWAASLRPKMTP